MPAETNKTPKSLFTPRVHFESFIDLLKEELGRDESFKSKYLLDEILSKLLDPAYAESDEVRRSAAIEKWLGCENTNRETSMRLIIADDEDVVLIKDDVFPVSIVDVIAKAREYITRTIGDYVPWDELKGSFSGGASTKMSRGPGTIARKFQLGSDITEAAIMPFLRLTKSDVWAPRDFDLVGGNVMFTVPKSTSIDRCAAKEPEFNMYVQKAIGDFYRRRLMRVGINLNDQSINQDLARLGSKEGNLATVDLSSASDSITRQLVLMIMPDDWFHLMDAVRSPYTWIDDVAHENFMFSSMGNGYTFELESMIFWALTRAVCYFSRTKGRISVYGDDIICPSGIRDDLIEVFTFCGFKVNPKKSFFDGDFRESCGKHWNAGVDVTPFYIKKVPEDVSDWCLLLNSLRKWASIEGGICDPRYFDLWELFALEVVPKPLWGGKDLSVRSNLVAPGRFPIARCAFKQRVHVREESAYSHGAYLHWLSATEKRNVGDKVAVAFNGDSELSLLGTAVTTSSFKSDGVLHLKRHRESDKVRRIPTFPQEHSS